MAERYNGYANYETWVICVQGDNDASLMEGLATCADEGIDPERSCKEYVQAVVGLGDMGSGVAHDLLRGALDDVDWEEVVEHFKSEDEDDEEADVVRAADADDHVIRRA